MNNIVKTTFLITLMSLQLSMCAQPRQFDKTDTDTYAEQTIQNMLFLIAGDEKMSEAVLLELDQTWEDGYIPMLLDAIYFSRGNADYKQIVKLIEKKTNKKYGADIFRWFEWVWNQEPNYLPFQGDWMARIYKGIDPKFEKYFKDRTQQSLIRLDEVRWGGVVQDGIPPLRKPKMLELAQADYLDDDDVVFGVSINGDHRAYPKRILAWHEMFVDEIGGENIAGVYCTLCGTVIAYNTTFEGVNYELGTSGFLYRSNKVMYDRATQSLWNTIEGKPVIGPLINKGIELNSHAVVTTTWGEWKGRHPDTKVLSLETGYNRNYDEGNAYKEYFATDDLMFNVPELDNRLPNKSEVLIIRADGYQSDPLAISANFLSRNKVYQDKIADTNFVVVTDSSGGNRVFESKDHKFKKMKNGVLLDNNGKEWTVEEERLISSDGTILPRLPYHRIFWFAWFSTYKNTRLVK